jgi:hypothetical protein
MTLLGEVAMEIIEDCKLCYKKLVQIVTTKRAVPKKQREVSKTALRLDLL